MNLAAAFLRWSAGLILLALALATSANQTARSLASPPGFWAWAQRPPLGWNSRDCFGTTVTEAQVRAQADVMAAQLRSYGWEYIVVDIQWYKPGAHGQAYRQGAELTMDEWGRLWPATNRFPSSVHGAGFKPLAEYVHAKGLKFGLHSMRGIPRQAVHRNTPIKGTPYRARDIANTNSLCPWNPDMYGVNPAHPAAQAWYDSVFELLARWGVDYVKVDDISRPYHEHEGEIELIRRAIDRCGCPMVLSLSPGETPLSAGDHALRHANLWRISEDFQDHWPALWEQFRRLHQWTPFRGPGHWPDADMLPLGVLESGRRSTRFTRDEQLTLMTLWCIARSPLIFGGDLTRLDAWTLSLLTNREVLAVNQFSTGNRQLFRHRDRIAWVAEDPATADRYLALFHAPPPAQLHPHQAPWQSSLISPHTAGQRVAVDEPLPEPTPGPVGIDLAELGFHGPVRVRDLWAQRDMGQFEGRFGVQLPPHAAGLYRLSPVLRRAESPHGSAGLLRASSRLRTPTPPPPALSGERLDRGLVAFLLTNGQTYVSWRLLLTDPPAVRFLLERSPDGKHPWELCTPEPLSDRCNFLDRHSQGRPWFYRVRAVAPEGSTQHSAPVRAEPVEGPTAFRRIRLQGNYRFDKVGIADLDGDGALDFVIKQPHQISDPGVWRPSEDTFKLEAYRSDGTFLWRRDLGWNIEQGVWWSPMVVYDLDGDGRAEVAVKTAPTDVDYRDATGRVTRGPEWCSILEGRTGRELARVDWPERGQITDWGDPNNNRASRHLMGVAYLDGRRPSLLLMRGTYTKMVVHAYNFHDGALVPVWKWCGDDERPPVRGQGMHGVHTVDLDGDGCDEIVLGAAVLRPTGRILWNLGMGHPDAVYVSDILPHRPGLEILYGFETRQPRNGICLVDGRSGQLLWGCDHPTDHVHSQGMFGDFDPDHPGPEFYTGEKFKPDRWTYGARDGRLLSQEDLGSLAPYALWWADGWTRWIAVRGRIGPYRGSSPDAYEGRVVAVGDILGDWREELVTCLPGELRIYTTTIPTATRRLCWLHDRAYRTGLAHAAMGYLFPPQPTGTLLLTGP